MPKMVFGQFGSFWAVQCCGTKRLSIDYAAKRVANMIHMQKQFLFYVVLVLHVLLVVAFVAGCSATMDAYPTSMWHQFETLRELRVAGPNKLVHQSWC